MSGPAIFENPRGSPRLRRLILVLPSPSACQVYVVSIGNGPSAVRITSFVPGTSSTTSYVYASRRPRKWATNARREPRATGGGVFHSTALMFTYHAGALDGSPAYAATWSGGRAITISVTTSTAIA